MYYLNKYHSLIPCGTTVNKKLPQGGNVISNSMVCKHFSFSSFDKTHILPKVASLTQLLRSKSCHASHTGALPQVTKHAPDETLFVLGLCHSAQPAKQPPPTFVPKVVGYAKHLCKSCITKQTEFHQSAKHPSKSCGTHNFYQSLPCFAGFCQIAKISQLSMQSIKAKVGGPARLALRSEAHQKQTSSNWTFALKGLKQTSNKKIKMLCSVSKHGKIIDALASDAAKEICAGNSLNVIRKIVQLKTKHLNNQDKTHILPEVASLTQLLLRKSCVTKHALQNQENLSKINPTKILESTFKNSDYSRNAIQKGKIESSTKSNYQLQDKTASDAMNSSGTSTVRKASASKLNVFLNKSYNKHTNQYFAINNQSMDLQATSRPKVATSVAWVLPNAKPIGKRVAPDAATHGFALAKPAKQHLYVKHANSIIDSKTKGFSSFFGIKKNTLSNKSWMLKNKEKTMADLSFSRVKNNLNKESLYKSFNNPNTRYSKMMEISLITISLASANRIRQWAEKTLPNGKVVGEVINPETVHYKTLKPIKGGLFCERIFGPLKDYECACGKKFNIKQYLTKDVTLSMAKTLEKRYFCRVCDVEYTYSLIRRTQLGYIALATPTTHVWFVKGLPSYISILLDMKKTHLQNVIYNIRTLTLEHAFRGPRNMPTSPSVIYETWQKIMQAQYPDKYGQPKENLLKTDLKKQSGNITPLLLKNQKTQPAVSKTSPTQKLNKTGLAGPTKKQANSNYILSECNNQKNTVLNSLSNKLTPHDKQKYLRLLSPKKIKQIYKENKKKYSRSLNLYNQYDNKSFKKTSLIKVYSFFSVKSSYILQHSTSGKEQDALPKDKTQNMYTYSSFLTSPVINGLLFNKVLASYTVDSAPHTESAMLHMFLPNGQNKQTQGENQRLQNIHILPWWTKLLNDKNKHSWSIESNRRSLYLFFCIQKTKTEWMPCIQHQNHLLISNLLNTSLYKFWEFFGKINQKAIYSVFGHDWFDFKGNTIKTRKVPLTNSVRTQAQFGFIHQNKAQFFTTRFLNKLLIYTSQRFNHKKAIYSTDVILKPDNNLILPCDLLLRKLKNFEKHTTKLAIMFLLNIKNTITTNKTKADNQITNTTFTKLKRNSLLTSMVCFCNIEKQTAQLESAKQTQYAVHKPKQCFTKNNLKPIKGQTNKQIENRKQFSFYALSKVASQVVPNGTTPKHNEQAIIRKIKFFNKFTNIVKGKCVQRLFTYYQTSNNQKHIVRFAYSNVEAIMLRILGQSPRLGFDTRNLPRKGLSNKTQALPTSNYFTSKILTHYFFFLKPQFKKITSTIYNSLLNDTIKIQKCFNSLVKHQRLAISQLDIACQFPVQNIVLTYFFRLKAFFDFMNNAKHSFDINFRIKKLDTKYLIMGSIHNQAKLGSSDVDCSQLKLLAIFNTGGQMPPRDASTSLSLSLELNNKPLLVNNIYCLSHRGLWEQEKDWQDFAYYYYPSNWLVENILKSSKNQISIETPSYGRLVSPSKILPDLFIPFYKHRNYEILFKFDNSFTYTDRNYFTENFQNYSLGMNINTAFSGAGLIQKLLNDFDFSELKKLDKQNRVLLFEYNKYIKKLKIKLALEMKAPPRKKSKEILKNKLKRVYFKACRIRDTLIRRTKLTRKIFNFIEDTTFSKKKLGSVWYDSGNQQLRTSKQTKDSDIVTGSARAESALQTQLVKHGTEKEPITNGLNMILTLLPVLPPVLRPVLKMSGQFTVSDLNRLYQRIIYRNERLKKFLQDPALNSSFEMKYAQRLVQEAVDNLIQNGKSGVVPEKDTRGRLLKSLSDILKGKQGRFRQYLLGKRVDYSGRSVIVVGPRLKLHECGIPKEMALVLYSPFLIKRILNEKIADTYLAAKKIIKTNPLLVSQLLREIMKACPVLLNRAPTLHRLGFQAFQPKLVDGKAILLHPLVCPAFNADFDGDQMAVHVPITFEARAEAWKLMLARNNLLSPATGDPLILPSQDMVLGCYYLTFLPTQASFNLSVSSKKGSGLFFHNINSVLKAYNQQLLQTHNIVWVNIQADIENGNIFEEPLEIRLPLAQYKLPESALQTQSAEHNKKQLLINSTTQTSKNPYYNFNYIEIYSRSHNFLTIKGTLRNQIIRTTPGKILFNMLIKKALEKKASLTV